MLLDRDEPLPLPIMLVSARDPVGRWKVAVSTSERLPGWLLGILLTTLPLEEERFILCNSFGPPFCVRGSLSMDLDFLRGDPLYGCCRGADPKGFLGSWLGCAASCWVRRADVKGGRSVAASGDSGLCISEGADGRTSVACDKGLWPNCRDAVDKLGGASRGPEDGRGSSSEPLADTVSSEVRAETAQHSDVDTMPPADYRALHEDCRRILDENNSQQFLTGRSMKTWSQYHGPDFWYGATRMC